MAEISQIKLPDGSVNSIKDAVARKLVKGTLNATGTAAPDVSSLGEGQVWFYVITDGTLTGSKVKFSDTLSKAFFGKTGVGASVGDLLMVTKVKYLLVTTTVYKVIPLNDAKAADGDFPGCDGLETIWDKTQINKIPSLQNSLAGVENREMKTYGESNMNNALDTGFYPWCTTGRPAGSDGAFTLKTLKSKDAEGNGYYTIEQIAYGRQNSVAGKVYYRQIYWKSSSENVFNEWVEITKDTITTVVNSLTTVDTTKALSAYQGKILNDGLNSLVNNTDSKFDAIRFFIEDCYFYDAGVANIEENVSNLVNANISRCIVDLNLPRPMYFVPNRVDLLQIKLPNDPVLDKGYMVLLNTTSTITEVNFTYDTSKYGNDSRVTLRNSISCEKSGYYLFGVYATSLSPLKFNAQLLAYNNDDIAFFYSLLEYEYIEQFALESDIPNAISTTEVNNIFKEVMYE